MKNVVKIINEADDVYGDGVIGVYFNLEDGRELDPVDGGDTLALFVGREIVSVFDSTRSIKINRLAAAHALHAAAGQLQEVARHLEYMATRPAKVQKVRIPKDFEVQPLKPGQAAKSKATCGTCRLSWDDGICTSMTPAPAARCPFEAFHLEVTA